MKPHHPRLRIEFTAWLRLTPQVPLTCLGIGALKVVEILISAPLHGTAPLLVVALAMTAKFWLAGATLGLFALVVWAVRRSFGPSSAAAKPPPPSRPLTREMRLRGWGFNIVAAWVVLSVLVLIVMSDTGTGPFAWLATGVFGLRDFAGLATFLLGLPAFAAPLVLLATLPWQTRWPLLAGVQAAVKPGTSTRPRRRRR